MKKPHKSSSSRVSTANLLQPRLCHLIKWPDYEGFGFNLMTRKEDSGHFIADVEQLGPADLSGLRDNDRVIEVNGTNTEKEAHLNVAQMIAASGDEVKMLVVDDQTYSYYQKHGYPLDSSNMNIVYIRTPDKQPNGSFEPTVVYDHNFAEDSYVMSSSREESTMTKKTYARISAVPEPSRVSYKETTKESVEMTQISHSVKVEPESTGSRESGFASLPDHSHTNGRPANPNFKPNPPRLCQIVKYSADEGYGFSLNTPKDRRGHFVSKIDDGSPASDCGIKIGDRIIEVNSKNIELTPHGEITEMIRQSPDDEVTLLVIDVDSHKWYCEQGVEVTGTMPNIVRLKNPEKLPENINSVGVHLTPKLEPKHLAVVEEVPIRKVSRQNSAADTNGHAGVTRTSSGLTTGKEFILPEDAPTPRLCHMLLVPTYSGFGFGLRTYKATGFKYIVDIKPRSPAYYSGLREWDRVIEVNGINVNVDNHSQVCGRIQYNPSEIKLLVMDEQDYLWYTKRNLVPKSTQRNVIYLSNLVENVEANSSPMAGGQNVYDLSTAEVRERISTLKRNDPRNKNVDFQKRIELYEQL